MDSDLSDRVRRIVAQKAGVPVERINGDSRLFQDLGLGGDDAAELLARISRECQMDASTFDFASYFPPEPTLVSVLLQREGRRQRKELTVDSLIQAASSGKLVG